MWLNSPHARSMRSLVAPMDRVRQAFHAQPIMTLPALKAGDGHDGPDRRSFANSNRSTPSPATPIAAGTTHWRTLPSWDRARAVVRGRSLVLA